MNFDTNDLMGLLKNPAFILMAVWLFKEVWSNAKRKNLALDSTLKDLSDKINQLTIAVVKLEAQLQSIDKLVEIIPKMREDINASHDKIRSLGNA